MIKIKTNKIARRRRDGQIIGSSFSSSSTSSSGFGFSGIPNLDKLKIDEFGNLFVPGNVISYADFGIEVGSIFDNLPIATTSSKGIAQFSDTHFNVVDGLVTIKDLQAGLNETELETYLTNNNYATHSWVTSQNYLTSHQDLTGYATETWVNNQNFLTSHQSLTGYATENWVNSNFNKYVHPANHAASIITQDSTHRFVTDSEKSDWNAKWNWNASTVAGVKVNNSVLADKAVKLNTARTISLSGDLSGSTSFDGSANKTISTKVNSLDGVLVEKIDGEDTVVFTGNIVATGNIVGYGDAGTNVGTIFDNLPDASTTSKGVAQFSSSQFTVSNGVVSIKSDEVGLNESELNTYLTNNSYATKTWVNNNSVKRTGDTVTGNYTFNGNLNIAGNITQNGASYITDAEHINVGSNLAVMNQNETGAGVSTVLDGTTIPFSGWSIERGSEENFYFGFDEQRDRFVVGKKTELKTVAAMSDSLVHNKLLVYNTSTHQLENRTEYSAFNKNFGTSAGTVAQGNDSRIVNGQTAYNWGNHASVGYYNSSNSNKSTVDWRARDLFLYGSARLKHVNSILVQNGNTQTLFDVDFNQITSAEGKYRFGRNTNTSGNLKTEFYRGDGTGNITVLIDHRLGDMTLDGKMYLGDQITPSSAKLQVNGFMRSGNIFIHEGGNNPVNTRNNDYLANVGGTLKWAVDGSEKTVYHSGHFANNSSNWNTAYSWGNHAGLYLPLSGSAVISGNKNFHGTDTSGTYSSAPIEIREVNLVGNAQSADAYAPAITWHWGNRTQGQLALNSGGQFEFRDGGSFDTFRNLRVGNLRADSASIGTDVHTSGYGLDLTLPVHMHANNINFVNQLHFNDNLRFVDEGNDSYLRFKYADTSVGGIKFYNGNEQRVGMIYGSGSDYFGLLDADANWAVQIQKDSHISLLVNNSAKFRVGTSTSDFYQPINLNGHYLFTDGVNSYSVDLKDHSNHTWLRNQVGAWTFQSGTSGDDWTQTYSLHVPNAGSTDNAQWGELGQRSSNNTNGRYRGLRIVKRDSSTIKDGDLLAGNGYFTNTVKFGKNATYGTTGGVLAIETQDGTGDDGHARIMWKENSKSWNYGISIGYSGDSTAKDFPSGATNGGTNAKWYLRRHDGNTDGADVIWGLRGSNNVNFTSTISTGGDITVNTSGSADLWLKTTNSSTYRANIQAAYNYTTPFVITGYSDHAIMRQQSGSSYLRFYTGNSERMYLSSAGMNVTGSVTATSNITAYSDIRLKDNIQPLTGALNKVNQLRGVTYTRKDQEDKSKVHIGLIAQEVEKVFPELVETHDDEDKTKSVNYQNMVAVLLEAVKELTDKVEYLENKIGK